MDHNCCVWLKFKRISLVNPQYDYVTLKHLLQYTTFYQFKFVYFFFVQFFFSCILYLSMLKHENKLIQWAVFSILTGEYCSLC